MPRMKLKVLVSGRGRGARNNETNTFNYVNTDGYFHSIPGVRCVVHRYDRGSAKGHGIHKREGPSEVAPSQFENQGWLWEVVVSGDRSRTLQMICAKWPRSGDERVLRPSVSAVNERYAKNVSIQRKWEQTCSGSPRRREAQQQLLKSSSTDPYSRK